MPTSETYCIGINHHTAPVHIREKVALTTARQHEVLARVGPEEESLGDVGSDTIQAQGLLVLATCNRVEFYLSLPGNEVREDVGLSRDEAVLLLARLGVDLGPVKEHVFVYAGEEAARHLGRVAAGLDAVVLGEAQILGQIHAAVQLSREHGALDAHLGALMKYGLKAGRRARAETGIGRNPVSVGSVGIRLAERVLGTLHGKTVVVLGLGETGQLALKVLRSMRPGRLVLINRTHETAIRQAAEWKLDSGLDAGPEAQAETAPVMELPGVLAHADLVFSATGCPYPMMSRDMISEAMSGRPDRELVVMDMAVPHDVEPEAATVPGVRLFDVDALESEVNASLDKRRQAIPDVERILEDELMRHVSWRSLRRTEPLISELRQQAETIRQQEVARFTRRMSSLEPDVQEQVDRFSQALVKKLLHHPTMQLRDGARESASDVTGVVRQLFQLDRRSGT